MVTIEKIYGNVVYGVKSHRRRTSLAGQQPSSEFPQFAGSRKDIRRG